MHNLSDAEIREAIQPLDGWEYTQGVIRTTYTLSSFPEALLFVNAVGYLAEQADHHPDMDIRYRKVTCALVTHSAGGVTEKDVAMARTIASLAGDG